MMTRCDKNYSAKLLFLCLSHSGPVTVCKLASIKDPSLRSTAEGPREPLSLHLEEKVTFGQGTLRTQHGGQRQSHVKQPELFGEWQVIGGGGMGWGGERRAWRAGRLRSRRACSATKKNSSRNCTEQALNCKSFARAVARF